MRLKRSGYFARALGILLVAALLIGSQALVMWHLVTAGQLPVGVIPFLIFFGILGLLLPLLLDIIFPVFGLLYLYRARMLSAVGQGDARYAQLATHQPDVSLALSGAETLTLTRRQTQRNATGRIGTTAMCLLLGLFGAVPVILVLPHLRDGIAGLVASWLSFTSAPAPASPDPLDWLSLAFAPILGLVMAIWNISYRRVAEGKRSTKRIFADDRGITTEGFGRSRHPQFIPWDDVRVVLRWSEHPAGAPTAAYVLWGQRHLLEFQIFSEFPTQFSDDRTAQNLPRYQFDGGYETYIQDANRLVATIAARTHLPFYTSARSKAFVNGLNRRFPVTTFDLEDALAAPLATSDLQLAASGLQPSAEVTAHKPAFGTVLHLSVRQRLRPILLKSFLWFIPLGALSLWLMNAFMSGFVTLSKALAGDPLSIGTFACFALLMFGMSIGFAAAQHYGRLGSVSADDFGLHATHSSGGSQTSSISLAWLEIRAWAVLPPPADPARGRTYIAFSDTKKLSWTELPDAELAGRAVKGDRRAAYRATAARLHAMIVARTGLPLREIPAPTATQSAVTASQP